MLSGTYAPTSTRAVVRTSRAYVRVLATCTGVPAFAGRDAAQPGNRNPRPENVSGSFYVDHTCIDCDTCRTMAPETFSRIGQQSAVHHQPTDAEGRVAALQALFSCPAFSIHTKDKVSDEVKAAQQGLPRRLPGTKNVYTNGWRSIHALACESYFIVRPGGNVMIDTPRFNPALVKQLKEMGGVKYIFLTHKDHVGEHKAWAKHFKATRILHTGDVEPDTQDVELKLTGSGPWRLPDGGDDVTLIFTPGHTSGHVCLFYEPDKVICTGDHMEGGYLPGQDLFLYKEYTWYSLPLQLANIQKLLEYDWLHVLSGHGRPKHLRDAAHRLEAVSKLLQEHNFKAEDAPQPEPAAVAQ